ncbi:2-C-methyl-D-erythritol 4-phosphate cytidylyltransferase [Botrimarina colliarenosi]|uniref:2-C-methyl-D-erythritol 4-phosphate cytidylyltransferase n=1 Tax=Botrimarina colliarenosi TaxID=2528001 RepID=A0A5C6A9J1_9BACT|nr:2-C-methyl-D-erythritol 4-phosphate cytidylyltransferase [Botrimarina colliarenosi]TWT96017.1 2-C-methyl-D-erythritol 4-phosphate cytidylyltransferase [Botrimarina colliarenosi]
MSKFAVLVLAAGRSSRFGDATDKKPFVTLDGRAVWMHSVERFVARTDVCQTIVVVSSEDREDFHRNFGANLLFMGADLCEGGAERADSVRAGLAKVSGDATHIAIHDAARPLVTVDEVDRVFAAAVETGAAILATPVTATLKRVADNRVTETAPRDGLWAAQTPQAFELGLFRRAVAAAEGAVVTDDAQLIERLGEPVAIVEGSPQNLKITTQDDLKLAAAIFADKTRSAAKKPGRLVEDDDFWS